MKAEIEKLSQSVKNAKEENRMLQNKIRGLEEALSEREFEIEKSAPYLNKVLEDKKNGEL